MQDDFGIEGRGTGPQKIEIEAFVLDVAKRVRDGQPIEDDRVEAKSIWPVDHHGAARRIAGHCNSVSPDWALWIIGIDEDGHKVVGAEQEEVSAWWAQVRKHFDGGIAPALQTLAVPSGDVTVMALFFDTDRAPFVVKHQGPVEREVPWREGTRVLAARREHLVQMLAPLQMLPTFETLRGNATCKWAGPRELTWHIEVELYVDPKAERLTIPNHKCSGQLLTGADKGPATLCGINLKPPKRIHRYPILRTGRPERVENLSKTIESTVAELLIYGPGVCVFRAQASTEEPLPRPTYPRVSVAALLVPVGSARGCRIEAEFRPDKVEEEPFTWRCIPSPSLSY